MFLKGVFLFLFLILKTECKSDLLVKSFPSPCIYLPRERNSFGFVCQIDAQKSFFCPAAGFSLTVSFSCRSCEDLDPTWGNRKPFCHKAGSGKICNFSGKICNFSGKICNFSGKICNFSGRFATRLTIWLLFEICNFSGRFATSIVT